MASINFAFVRYGPFHSRYGLSPTKNSTLKKPVGSVPSSGRPCSDATTVTSGKERRIRRTCGAILRDSSKEIV